MAVVNCLRTHLFSMYQWNDFSILHKKSGKNHGGILYTHILNSNSKQCEYLLLIMYQWSDFSILHKKSGKNHGGTLYTHTK